MSENQEDTQVSNEPALYELPPAETDIPLAGLTHSKVPLGAWYAEALIFAKRYFWSLFLLGIVMALLSYGASSGDALSCLKQSGCCGLQSALNAVDCAGSVYADDDDDDDDDDADDDNDDDDDDDHSPAAASAGSADAVAASASVNAAEANPSDTPVSEETPAAEQKEVLVKKECQVCHAACAFLSVVFGWMALCWGLRTVQKDDPSWKNLLFPSWQTVLKLIVLYFIFACLCAAAFAVFLSFHPFCAVFAGIAVLLIALYFGLRFSLSTDLLIDRDCGPLQAIGASWRFMRGNVWTLFVGMFVYTLVFGFISGIVTGAVSKLSGGAEQVSGVMTYLPSTIGIIFSALINAGLLALGSVFYLMATGQKRPGAWPRENA